MVEQIFAHIANSARGCLCREPLSGKCGSKSKQSKEGDFDDTADNDVLIILVDSVFDQVPDQKRYI